jgi:hypothetical protein
MPNQAPNVALELFMGFIWPIENDKCLSTIEYHAAQCPGQILEWESSLESIIRLRQLLDGLGQGTSTSHELGKQRTKTRQDGLLVPGVEVKIGQPRALIILAELGEFVDNV